jgi:hypothetical protein
MFASDPSVTLAALGEPAAEAGLPREKSINRCKQIWRVFWRAKIIFYVEECD